MDKKYLEVLFSDWQHFT